MRRLFLLLAVAVATGCGEEMADYVGSTPPARIALVDFSLPSYSGGVVSSGDLRGKVVLVTFLESKCEEACPVIATQVTRGLALLDEDERRRVVALAISANPADDTPASVRAFLRSQHATDTFRYLVGSEEELRPVWRSFQILSALDSGDADLHSAPVRIYDGEGIWVSTLHPGADLTPENLRHDLVEALT